MKQGLYRTTLLLSSWIQMLKGRLLWDSKVLFPHVIEFLLNKQKMQYGLPFLTLSTGTNVVIIKETERTK